MGVTRWPAEVFTSDGEDSLSDQDSGVAEGQDLDELQERLLRLDLLGDSDEHRWQNYFASVGYSYTECAGLSRRPKRMKLRIV